MGKRLLSLWISFLQIGLFSVGGGYATIPLIQDQVVALHEWITLAEFTDIITLSQMTPGPLAVNTSTFVGIQIGGIAGAVTATLGCILPGTLLSLTAYTLYRKYKNAAYVGGVIKGLRAASIGLIAASAAIIMKIAFWDAGRVNILSIVLAASSYFVLRKWKWNAIWIILLTGVIGLLIY